MDTSPNRDRRHRAPAALIAALLAAGLVLGAPVASITTPAGVRAAASFADPYFREVPVFTGLTKPTTVRFASDGRAFVAEKAGVVKAFDSIADTTPTTVIDLRTEVNSYWDRGLLGLAIDPALLSGRPYLYLYYVYDAPPGQTAPVWNDACSSPPGGTTDGCTVTSRLERVTINTTTNVAVGGSRQLLIADWCQQFPSHAGGGLAFGPDGKLYLSSGDGASFTTVDYGQLGGTLPGTPTPVNPCDDPPGGVGGSMTVPTAEGGTLRSQDVRTTGDPTGLDGTIIRVDPDTGDAPADNSNPLASSSDLNARRIVAHGFRNPFRWTFRPGTSEIYVGDVGNQTWEEIERVVLPTGSRTPTTMPNFGWPCYEGVAKSSLQSVGLDLCANLYGQASAVTAPLYQYSHMSSLSPSGPCFVPDASGKQSSSVTGTAFYEGPGPGVGAYPSKYNGALFFADYSRNCLAALLPGAGGIPNASTMETVASALSHPVDLLAGPGGDLFYVDLDGGRVVDIQYLPKPVARGTVTPPVSLAPVTVTLDASTSIDTDPAPGTDLVAWRWDLDHDGVFTGPADKSGKVVQWAIATPGIYPITLQVESSNGRTDTVELTVNASNDPPVPMIDPPSPLTWSVGTHVTFSGSATDPEDGPLPPSGLSWDLVMMHCPADCHEHLVQSWSGVSSGSFDAPDHDYPSHLELRLTATDSAGATATTKLELQPNTATINANSSPPGMPLLVAGESRPSPSTTTVIRNGVVSVSAPVTATIGGQQYRFQSWDDGGGRTHAVTASAPSTNLTATFVADRPDACASATTTSPLSSWISERTSGNGDADWFRFQLTSARRVVITLGDLPVNGRLELYSTCSTRLATVDISGSRFEEYTRKLAAGTYRVRVTAPDNNSSDQPYVLRFRPIAAGLQIKSYRSSVTAGRTRIVGEVLNNTGSTRGPITVTATFRSSSGRVVATLKGAGFARRVGDGTTTSFLIAGTTPGWTSVQFSVTSVSAGSVPTLTLATFSATPNVDGTVTERGTIRNAGTRTARLVAIARVWYGRRGEVLDRGVVLTTPSTLARGASAPFSLLRPVLTRIDRYGTQLRALF